MKLPMYLCLDIPSWAPQPCARPGAVASAALCALVLALIPPGAARAARDPAPELFKHYAPLAKVDRKPAPSLGAHVQRWIMVSARGDSAFALWRPASPRMQRPWTAVLLGGFHTGDRTALLVPEDTTFNTLGVNWPWRGKRRLTPTEFAVALPAIQRACMSSPAVLALGVEAVARTPGVDPGRIVLVGASLGAAPALAALRLTSTPDALVLIDGGADIEHMIQAALEHEGWLSAPAAVSAAGAYQWLWPLEPTLNAPVAARLPVMLLNSSSDERIPRESIQKLQASLPHATVRWRTGPHIELKQKDVFAQLVRDVNGWLRGIEPPAAARPSAALASPH
jgi:hypothetical protein